MPRMLLDSAWEFLCTNPCLTLMSREREGLASNSEKLRWLQSGSVLANAVAVKPDDPWPDMLESLVLFPRSKMRITML